MTNKEHKELVLAAAETTLEEYKEGIHWCDLDTCHLCRSFYYSSNKGEKCKNCPMTIFYDSRELVGCSVRKCRLVSQTINAYKSKELAFLTARVVEFYENFIELVQQSRHCRLVTKKGNKTAFAKRLIKIDNEIYSKHEKIKENESY